MIRLLMIIAIMTLPLLGGMQLRQEYSYQEHEIYSTTLFPELKDKFILFNISNNRTSYRIKSSKVKELFNERNITIDLHNVRYVNFVKESPIDTTQLQRRLAKAYESYYKNLHVKNVTVTPRSYLEKMPHEFQLRLNNNNFKHAQGVFSIKTPENVRIFFDYRIKAEIDLFTALQALERGDTLSPLNAIPKTVHFDRFSAPPLDHIGTKEYRLKRSVKKGHIFTERDIESYPIVKKGNSVSVQMQSGSVIVEFSAIASQDGSKNDIISIQKKDGRRIKARVIAPGRVEIQ